MRDACILLLKVIAYANLKIINKDFFVWKF